MTKKTKKGIFIFIALLAVIGIGVLVWFNNQADQTQELLAQLEKSQASNEIAVNTELDVSSNESGISEAEVLPAQDADQANEAGATTSQVNNNDSNELETSDGVDNEPLAESQQSSTGWRNFTKPTEEILRQTLTPIQFKVTQEDGTERSFNNEYWDNTEPGIYVDIVSGEPLFSSIDKYRSGTGWPSFTKPLDGIDVVTKDDFKLVARRVEVRSPIADSHLGHVFPDGPTTVEDSGGAAPTGLRYCLNSAALEFVAASDLEARGYGEYTYLFN